MLNKFNTLKDVFFSFWNYFIFGISFELPLFHKLNKIIHVTLCMHENINELTSTNTYSGLDYKHMNLNNI